MKFLSSEDTLYLSYSLARNTVVMSGVIPHMLLKNKLQKRIYRTVGTLFAACLESLAHHRHVASFSLFFRYYFSKRSFELTEMIPSLYSRGRSTHYSERLHDFSVTIPRCYKDLYVNSFFSLTAILWSSLSSISWLVDSSFFLNKYLADQIPPNVFCVLRPCFQLKLFAC